MKIYKLTRTDRVDYDEFDSIIVIAKNETNARKIKPSSTGTWSIDNHILCELIGTASKSYKKEIMLLGSFNAG